MEAGRFRGAWRGETANVVKFQACGSGALRPNFTSKGPGGDVLREGEQLIDGPLVVGVGAILHRVNPSRRRDQEVGWQPQGAPGKSQAEMTVRHTPHRGPQGLDTHEAERGFDAEVLVKGFLRIADHQKWDILLVRAD